MEINLGEFIIQVSDTQKLSIFWALTVLLAFNVAYFLFVKDRELVIYLASVCGQLCS